MTVSSPMVEAKGGIYQFQFNAEKIAIRVDRLYETRDRLTAEIRVMSKQPGEPLLLHQTRFNLFSTSGRRDLAKHLFSRLELTDWNAVIEIICMHVLAIHRQGNPVVDVGDAPIKPQRYRLSPWLLENETNLIYGAGGTGKSYVGCLIGVLVQSGQNHCDLTPVQGNVLYLDYETSEAEINQRVQLIRNGLSLPSCTLAYRFCSQALAHEIGIIQRIVLEHKINLVIVDSVGSACGGEPESAEIVLKYFMALRSLEITTLSIDHVTKHGDGKAPFGSIYKYNSARSIYELRSSQDPELPQLDIGLYHRKCNMGKLQYPFGLSLAFQTEHNSPSVVFDKIDVSSVPELSTGLPLQSQIGEVLKRGAMTAQEIAAELSCPAASVRVILNRNKAKFTKVDWLNHKWGLLAND